MFKRKVVLCVLTIVYLLLFSPLSFAQDVTMEDVFEIFAETPKEVSIASARPEDVSMSPANVFVISGDEMRGRGYRTLYELIQDLPGTTIINRVGLGARAAIPVIRGVGDERRLKLMLNGMTIDPLNGAGTAWLERFPITGIEKVEFILGPYAALYGRNTFSGVLNVITKKSEKINGGIFETLYGTYDQMLGSGVYAKKQGDYDFYISAFKNYSKKGIDLVEEYPEIYGLDVRKNSTILGAPVTFASGVSTDFIMPWDFTDIYFKSGHSSGLSLDVNYNKSISSKIGTGLSPLFYASSKSAIIVEENWNSRLQYEKNWDEKIFSTSSFHYQDFVMDIAKNEYLIGLKKWNGLDEYTFSLEERLRFKINDWNELYAGVSYDEVREHLPNFSFSGPAPKGEKLKTRYYTASLQDEIVFWEKLHFVLGLMYENADAYEDVLLPRFSAVWKAVDKTTLKFIYGTGYLTPDPISHLDQITSPRSGSIKGVDNLNPETLTSYEINVLHKLKENVNLKGSVFVNKVDDLITTVSASDLLPNFGFTWKNVGEKAASGAEIGFDGTSKFIKWFFSYAYVDGNYDEISGTTTTDVGRLPLSSPHHFKTGVNFLLFQDKLNFYVHNLLTSDQERFADKKFSGYNLTDINLLTTPKFNKTWYFSLGVKNLFDERAFQPEGLNHPLGPKVPVRRRYYTIMAGVKF